MSLNDHQNDEDLSNNFQQTLMETLLETSSPVDNEQEIKNTVNILKPSETLLPTIDDLLSKLRRLYPTLTSVEVNRMLDSNSNEFIHATNFSNPFESLQSDESSELLNYNSTTSPSTHSSLGADLSVGDIKCEINENKIETDNNEHDQFDLDENDFNGQNLENKVGKLVEYSV